MITLLTHDRAALLVGDSKNLGDTLPENCIDAIVCDPPAGISFMGKEWDEDKGDLVAWAHWLAGVLEPAFRALKPGGHALVWALPRTSWATGLALHLAGFEIRDRHSHLFGTGFPKSLNISKEIDRVLGASNKRVVVADNPNHRAESGVEYEGVYAGGNTGAAVITAPATPEARQWEGFGTALKPACEDWWLCRKPLAGTVARNVLEYGTGGLNIDGCRIATEEDLNGGAYTKGRQGRAMNPNGAGERTTEVKEEFEQPAGRWPAHISFDEEAAAALDAQAGTRKSGKPRPRTGSRKRELSAENQRGGFAMTDGNGGYGDEGGVSRFFYVAKPSKAEKNAGCEALPEKSGGEATDRKDGSAGLKNPRAGAGRGGGARNHHPTVKSIALMRWLCRLITPPGGTILDPFCGSGSTGVAALAEGFSFVGVEQSAEYAEIAKARLEHALKGENDNG